MDTAQREGRRDLGREKFWREIIRKADGSGKSVRGFCSEKGLNESQFYFWRRELELRDREKESKGGFVELIGTGGENGSAGISIRVDNRLSIEVGRGFDVVTLKALLACLQEGGRGNEAAVVERRQ